MFEKEVMIAGLRKQRDVLKELIEELEDNTGQENRSLEYCDEVLKRVESTLRRLRRFQDPLAKRSA